MAIWYLWKARNKWIFEGKAASAFDISRKALAHARETAGALNIGAIVTGRAPTLVHWTAPPQDHYKLNTDGSLNHVTKNASAGGLIRDCHGQWISGFTVNIGTATIFEAELWGLREGLRHCLTLGISKLHAEMDSIAIVQMLQSGNQPSESLHLLMLDCIALTHQFQSFSISHVFREGNRAADRIAELAHHANKGTTPLQAPPPELQIILSADRNGQSVLRF